MSSGIRWKIDMHRTTFAVINKLAGQDHNSSTSNSLDSRSSASTAEDHQSDLSTANTSGLTEDSLVQEQALDISAHSPPDLEPQSPQKDTAALPTLSEDSTRSKSSVSKSTLQVETTTPIMPPPTLAPAQQAQPTTSLAPSGKLHPPSRYCCNRSGCTVSGNSPEELRRHVGGGTCKTSSTSRLTDSEITKLAWAQWFLGKTQWLVSTHTFNQFKSLLTQEQQLGHHHVPDTTEGRSAIRKGGLKRKAIDSNEQDEASNEDDTEDQPPSKRLRKSSGRAPVTAEQVATTTSYLPAHSKKRKSRHDDDEKDDEVEHSNKRIMATDPITKAPVRRTPRGRNSDTQTFTPEAPDQLPIKDKQHAAANAPKTSIDGSTSKISSLDVSYPPKRTIYPTKKRADSEQPPQDSEPIGKGKASIRSSKAKTTLKAKASANQGQRITPSLPEAVDTSAPSLGTEKQAAASLLETVGTGLATTDVVVGQAEAEVQGDKESDDEWRHYMYERSELSQQYKPLTSDWQVTVAKPSTEGLRRKRKSGVEELNKLRKRQKEITGRPVPVQVQPEALGLAEDETQPSQHMGKRQLLGEATLGETINNLQEERRVVEERQQTSRLMAPIRKQIEAKTAEKHKASNEQLLDLFALTELPKSPRKRYSSYATSNFGSKADRKAMSYSTRLDLHGPEDALVDDRGEKFTSTNVLSRKMEPQTKAKLEHMLANARKPDVVPDEAPSVRGQALPGLLAGAKVPNEADTDQDVDGEQDTLDEPKEPKGPPRTLANLQKLLAQTVPNDWRKDACYELSGMTYPRDKDHPKVIEYSAARYIEHLTATITYNSQGFDELREKGTESIISMRQQLDAQKEEMQMLRAQLGNHQGHMLPTPETNTPESEEMYQGVSEAEDEESVDNEQE